MAVNKTLILFSALAGVGGTIGIVYAANPGYIFSPSIEKVMKRMYDEGWRGYEKITNIGDNNNETALKEREKKGKKHLRDWAEKTLCPTFKREIEVRVNGNEKYKDYETFFDVIQTQCSLEREKSSQKIPFSDYSLKSILYGLKDFIKRENPPKQITQSKVS